MGWKIGTFVFGTAALVGAYFGILGMVMASQDEIEANRLRKQNKQLIDALDTSIKLNAKTFPIATKALQSVIETS